MTTRTLSLHENSDSGVKDDNLTKDTNIRFHGTGGTPGATVDIIHPTLGKIASATVGSNGVYHATMPRGTNLPANTAHTVSAVQTVAATKTTPAVVTTLASYTFTIDTTNPNSVSNVDVEGADDIINKAEADSLGGIQVTGTAEPGSRVWINNGQFVVADSAGAWAITVPAPSGGFAQGTLALVIKSMDQAGNESTPVTKNVTIDTVATVTVGNIDDDNDLAITVAEKADGLQLSGTTQDGSTVLVNGASATVTTANGVTTWSITIPKASLPAGGGNFDVSVIATDPNGNTASASRTLSVAADPQAATVSFGVEGTSTDPNFVSASDIEGGDSFINAAEALGGVDVSGTATAGATITIIDGVGPKTTTADANGAWTLNLSPPTADGPWTITATVSMIGFLDATTSQTVTLDRAAPGAPTIGLHTDSNSGLKTDTVTNDTTPRLSGTAETGSTVLIFKDGTQVGSVVATDGTWSYTSAALTAGATAHSFTAQAKDIAGNVSGASSAVGVVIDTSTTVTIAVGTVTVPTGTYRASVELSGTGENGATITIMDNGVAIATTTVANGTWSYTATGVTDGSHSFSASAEDVAGNTASASAPASIIQVGGIGEDFGNGADNANGSDGDDNLAGGNGADFLFGLYGDDVMTGDNGSDMLDGGPGNDTLNGGRGDDILIGGAGDDVLTGGNGSDTFVFGAASGNDTITDFQFGFDKLSGVSGTLTYEKIGNDTKITHDGGTILLVGVDYTALDTSLLFG